MGGKDNKDGLGGGTSTKLEGVRLMGAPKGAAKRQNLESFRGASASGSGRWGNTCRGRVKRGGGRLVALCSTKGVPYCLVHGETVEGLTKNCVLKFRLSLNLVKFKEKILP